MLAGGYAYRFILTPSIQLQYKGGLAFNFIEIDTFRSNGDPNDDKYTDISVSTIHKLGVDFLVRKIEAHNILKTSQIRLGPSVFYYFSPNPLGKFKLDDNKDELTTGGSFAWYFEMKFEFY